jgi:hypothetical protein
VLMPETGLEGAMHLAETLRSRVEELGIPNPGAPGGVVTASVGSRVVSPSDDVTTEGSHPGRRPGPVPGQALGPQSGSGRLRALRATDDQAVVVSTSKPSAKIASEADASP